MAGSSVYFFTASRDLAVDVAAEMIWVGAGLSRLSPSGWAVLDVSFAVALAIPLAKLRSA